MHFLDLSDKLITQIYLQCSFYRTDHLRSTIKVLFLSEVALDFLSRFLMIYHRLETTSNLDVLIDEQAYRCVHNFLAYSVTLHIRSKYESFSSIFITPI
jgi:hypothetical protein